MKQTDDNMRRSRLRWFGHVQHRPSNGSVKSEFIQVEGTDTIRGRLRTWF